MPRSDWNYVSEFVFAIPPIEEQRKIAAVLQACDEEIELLGQKLAALKRQKRGLMQQLLTGRVRVMPSPPTPLPGGEGPGVRAKSLTPPWSIGPGNYAAR